VFVDGQDGRCDFSVIDVHPVAGLHGVQRFRECTTDAGGRALSGKVPELFGIAVQMKPVSRLYPQIHRLRRQGTYGKRDTLFASQEDTLMQVGRALEADTDSRGTQALEHIQRASAVSGIVKLQGLAHMHYV
jgi:hypothetical protein